jgi:hypothetical protein
MGNEGSDYTVIDYGQSITFRLPPAKDQVVIVDYQGRLQVMDTVSESSGRSDKQEIFVKKFGDTDVQVYVGTRYTDFSTAHFKECVTPPGRYQRWKKITLKMKVDAAVARARRYLNDLVEPQAERDAIVDAYNEQNNLAHMKKMAELDKGHIVRSKPLIIQAPPTFTFPTAEDTSKGMAGVGYDYTNFDRDEAKDEKQEDK